MRERERERESERERERGFRGIFHDLLAFGSRVDQNSFYQQQNFGRFDEKNRKTWPLNFTATDLVYVNYRSTSKVLMYASKLDRTLGIPHT